jgi:hypothetical protein
LQLTVDCVLYVETARFDAIVVVELTVIDLTVSIAKVWVVLAENYLGEKERGRETWCVSSWPSLGEYYEEKILSFEVFSTSRVQIRTADSCETRFKCRKKNNIAKKKKYQ